MGFALAVLSMASNAFLALLLPLAQARKASTSALLFLDISSKSLYEGFAGFFGLASLNFLKSASETMLRSVLDQPFSSDRKLRYSSRSVGSLTVPAFQVVLPTRTSRRNSDFVSTSSKITACEPALM